jgi:hypothetical protein
VLGTGRHEHRAGYHDDWAAGAGQPILRDQPGVLHVRVVARADDRIRRTQEVEWADPLVYHLTINASALSPETAVELIGAAARQLDAQGSATPSPPAA